MSRRLEGRVVIATHNGGKLREMRELLAPFGVEAVSAGELGLPVPAEPVRSFTVMGRGFDPSNPAPWTERAIRGS